MVKKAIFVVGVGVGYLLGSAAGRQSYETIKAKAEKLWQDPKVQAKVSEGAEWAKEKAPQVQEKVAETAKHALHRDQADESPSKAPQTEATMKPAEPIPAVSSSFNESQPGTQSETK
jgi:hypothetical protein